MKRFIFWGIVILLMLTGCGRDETQTGESSVKLYCTDASTGRLVWEYYEPQAIGPEEEINELLEGLGRKPETDQYRRLLPDSIKILGWSFGPDEQVIIDFSREYQELDTLTEIFLRAGIVKTLCQADGVDYVEFYCEGVPLVLAGSGAVGQMCSDDFIDNTGSEVEFRQNVNVTVYFANETGDMLTESLLTIENDGIRTVEELAINQLIAGPLESESGMLPIIPEGTVCNKVLTRNRVCTIDFNEAFLNTREGIMPQTVVYGIVNTLCDIATVQKVRFTINGETIKQYSDIPFNGTFTSKPELIITEKAGEHTAGD